MSDVANASGISKRTLYEAFHDKEELLDICFEENIKKSEMEIDEIVKSSEDVIETMMRIYTKYLSEMQNANKSTVYDLKKYHPSIYKKIECKQAEDTNSFIPLFQRGVEQGFIRKDLNIEITIWLLKSQFRALIENNFPSDKYSAGEIIRIIMLNFIRGIATLKGLEKIEKLMSELKN